MERVTLHKAQDYVILGATGLTMLLIGANLFTLCVTAWKAHSAMRVGEALMKECDGYYFEGESARARPYRALLDLTKALDSAVGGLLFAYMFLFFVVAANIIVKGAKDDRENRKKWIGVGVLAWILLSSLVWAAERLPIQAHISTGPKHTAATSTSVLGNAIFASLVLALTSWLVGKTNVDKKGCATSTSGGFLPGCHPFDRFWFVPRANTILFVAIALFVFATLTVPILYNNVVAVYETKRAEWTKVVKDMPLTDYNKIFKRVNANYFAGNNMTILRERCDENMVDYTLHERGNEYSDVDTKYGDKLREAIKSMRSYRDGSRAIKRWTAMVTAVTAVLLGWAAWGAWDRAYRINAMGLGGAGLKMFLGALFVLVFILTIVGWFTAHGIFVD